MGLEICGAHGDAFAILIVLLAPPRKSIVKDAPKLFDRERIQNLLGAGVGERIGVCANGRVGFMNDAGMIGEDTEHFRIIYVKLFDRRGGEIVGDDEDAVVVIAAGVVTEANPEDIPALPVRGMVRGFQAITEDEARAASEVCELGLDSDVPVRVILEDEGGRIAFFDDTRKCNISVIARV